jgi:glycosyltransferase involved in cell wall biosynthesis
MKIKLIIYLSEFNLGGAANSIWKLCKNLRKKNFEIIIICLNKCFFKKQMIKRGIKVYEIKSNKSIYGFFKIKKIVKKIIQNSKKNIFISNIHYSNILSLLFLRGLSLKIIIIERTPFQELQIYYGLKDLIKKMIIKLLMKILYKKADARITNSKYISERYNKYLDIKFITINPPSFKKLIFLKKKKENKENKDIVIGMVGRLSKEKNIQSIIKIMSNLNKKFKLVIVGNGPEEKKLKLLSKNLNLDKNIKFLNSVQPDNVSYIFKKFDYYLSSSDFEGFPNIVVEALSAGLPVISSQSYGGINDIIKDPNFGVIYKKKVELEIILNKILKKKMKFNMDKKKLYNHLNSFSEKKNTQNYKKLFFNI